MVKKQKKKAQTKSNECTEIILAAKEKYITELSKKLSNPETAPKTYWKILNRFLSNKKIPSIPPLLVNGEMISNFSKKAELFNKLFASQCTPLSNTSSWELAKSGAHQGSVLGPLFFFIYINDLPDSLESNRKIFADDTSLFYKVFDKHISRATLNKDLDLINNWAFQWKMQSNPDRNKQVQELYFSKKAGNQKSLDVNF